MTITCEATYFLPPLQGGPRLKSDTQGSAKKAAWAESCNRFAVNPTGSRVRYAKALQAGLSPCFAAVSARSSAAICYLLFAICHALRQGGVAQPWVSSKKNERSVGADG
jgi:hypothetical protein